METTREDVKLHRDTGVSVCRLWKEHELQGNKEDFSRGWTRAQSGREWRSSVGWKGGEGIAGLKPWGQGGAGQDPAGPCFRAPLSRASICPPASRSLCSSSARSERHPTKLLCSVCPRAATALFWDAFLSPLGNRKPRGLGSQAFLEGRCSHAFLLCPGILWLSGTNPEQPSLNHFFDFLPLGLSGLVGQWEGAEWWTVQRNDNCISLGQKSSFFAEMAVQRGLRPLQMRQGLTQFA